MAAAILDVTNNTTGSDWMRCSALFTALGSFLAHRDNVDDMLKELSTSLEPFVRAAKTHLAAGGKPKVWAAVSKLNGGGDVL